VGQTWKLSESGLKSKRRVKLHMVVFYPSMFKSKLKKNYPGMFKSKFGMFKSKF
jgi:hypothetical protein